MDGRNIQRRRVDLEWTAWYEGARTHTNARFQSWAQSGLDAAHTIGQALALLLIKHSLTEALNPNGHSDFIFFADDMLVISCTQRDRGGR